MESCCIAGTANNAGAILVLGRDLVVVPKLIHPLPPAVTSPESSPEHHLEDTWMQVLLVFMMLTFVWNLKGLVYWQIFRSAYGLQSLQAVATK